MLRFITRPRSIVITGLLLAGVLGAYALLYLREDAAPHQGPLANFEENGVAVALAWERDADGQGWLVGTFTPMLENFHVYSKDLPANGINGRGRPTVLDVASSSVIAPSGALVASPPAIKIYSMVQAQALPVYPDGAVTLRLPIEWLNNGASTPTELSVTYMACSTETCLIPVVDKRVLVEIPARP